MILSDKHRGNVLVLTFFFIILLTLEVAVVNLIAQRSLGESAILSTQNIAARYAQSAAFTRLEMVLNSYVNTSGTADVDADFAKGGSDDIDQVLDVNNPETGLDETGTVNIQAWLAQRRGIWYKLAARAQVADIDLVAYRWVKINPCSADTTPVGEGTLITILSNRPYPGMNAMPLNIGPLPTDGQIFFGEGYVNPVNFYTWKGGVLTTIVTGKNQPGYMSTVVDSTGRVFFGERSSGTGYYTWQAGVLSTLVSGFGDVGVESTAIAADDRVFFGARGARKVWSWKSGVLSTIISTATQPIVTGISQDGTLFVGSVDSAAPFLAWKSDVLTTIVTGRTKPGNNSTTVMSDGRVFFGEWLNDGGNSYNYYTWKSGVLSTIITNTINPGFMKSEWSVYNPSGNIVPGSRVFFGTGGWSNVGSDYVLTWQGGVLSTLPVSNTQYGGVGMEALVHDPTDIGRVYFGTSGSPTGLWTWKNGVLSTIVYLGNNDKVGHESLTIAADGRIFFGNKVSGASFWTYKSGVLSTILTGVNMPGSYSTNEGPDGRMYFSTGDPIADNVLGGFYTWKDGILSTIVSGVYSPGMGNDYGYHGNVVTSDGTVFFGEENLNGHFWAWVPASGISGCASRHY